MTTQKLDALMGSIEAYRTAGGREEHWARKDALEAHLSDLLEENERLLKVNDESAQELMDMCAHWKHKHEALRSAAQAVVDANNASIVPVDLELWYAIGELREALK